MATWTVGFSSGMSNRHVISNYLLALLNHLKSEITLTHLAHFPLESIVAFMKKSAS